MIISASPINFHKNYTWVSILILLLLVSFRYQQQPAALELKDVSYGEDSLQKLDVSLVEGRSERTPVVILIHGGGWMAGDKKDASGYRDFFVSHGYNVININYRLATSEVHYLEIMKDVAAALQLVTSKAGEWHIRNRNYIFWGGSAGGHIAMLYAYSYDKNNLIASVISLGGPSKLDDRPSLSHSKKEDVTGLLPLITGKPWSEDVLDTAYQLASPYYGHHFKPSLVIHGEVDTIVSWLQAKLMTDKLTESGTANQFFLIKNGWHGGEGASKEVSDSLQQTMVKWVEKYGK